MICRRKKIKRNTKFLINNYKTRTREIIAYMRRQEDVRYVTGESCYVLLKRDFVIKACFVWFVKGLNCFMMIFYG